MHRDHRRTFFTNDGVRPLAPSVRLQTRVVALASTHSNDIFQWPCRLTDDHWTVIPMYHGGVQSIKMSESVFFSLSISPRLSSM